MSSTLKKAIQKINRRVIFAGSAAAVGYASTVAFAQEGKLEEEEIIVTGIRGSLIQALDIKRDAVATVDAISAEDIGKFPDKNVADSLARIPGITINRDFGEGQGVTIRGFTPNQNKTMLNGQAVGTAQWFILNNTGRNFNFEMLASEMVGEVQVYKSPQADIEEGGLGGTVNVETRKPLDMDAHSFAGSIEGQYSSNPEKWDPGVSGLYSWKNDDQTLGINVALTSNERTVERISQESDFGWFGPGIARIEPGLAAPVGATEKGSIAWGVGSAIFQQKRERTGIDSTFQWRPSSQLQVAVHLLDVEMKASNTNSNLIGIPFRGLFNGGGRTGVGTVENGFVTNLEFQGDATQPGWANYLAYDNIYRDGSKMGTSVFDISVDYELGNALLHVVAGTTKGEGEIFDFFTEFWGDGTDPRVAIIYENENLSDGPNVEFDQANPWLSNPTDEMWLGGIFNQRNFTEDREHYFQADLTLDVELGAIDELKFGTKIRDRLFEQTRFRDDLSNLAAVGANSLGPASDFWEGALHTPDHSENALSSQRYFNPSRHLMWDAFWSQPVCTQLLLDAGTICRNENQTVTEATFKTDETITSFYAMASFSTGDVSGNVGVRYTDTSADTEGFIKEISFDNDYGEVLPSANVKYDVTEDVVLRSSAARVMSRPSPFSTAPAFNLTPETGRGDAGNPDLEPVFANQYDMGVEWYYADASIVSATWFRKDISNFIFTNTVQETIGGVVFNQLRRPTNGGNANYEGLEFQLTHVFDSGFGGFFNYTYVDASKGEFQEAVLIPADPADPASTASAALVTQFIEFPDVSDESYNAGVFYEDETFSVRLSYNWRSNYFVQNTEFGPQFRDSYGQWDAQFAYHITDAISIKAEVVNLTDESFNNYLVQRGDVSHPANGTRAVTTEGSNGQRFFVGVNFRF